MPRAATATSTETSTDLVDAAQHALDLVGEDPRLALEHADRIVAGLPRPRTPQEVRAFAMAQRAAGLALRSMGRPADAQHRMRRGLSVAERTHQTETAAEVRMSLAFVSLDLGRTRTALALTDQALGVLRGVKAARARTIRALVLQRCQRPREAFAEYDAALPILRRAHDGDWISRLLHNRALLHIELGETSRAISDLEGVRARDLELGRTNDAADALFNMGVACTYAGDIPEALTRFDLAESEWAGAVRPEVLIARAEALQVAGLPLEAAAQLEGAAEWLHERQWTRLEIEARLSMAVGLLACRPPRAEAAREQALMARELLDGPDRIEWEPLALYITTKADLLHGPDPTAIRRAAAVASTLRDMGTEALPADLRITAGQAALTGGSLDAARTVLGPLAVMDRARDRDVAGRAHLAQGLLAEAEGDLVLASRCLKRAWSVIEQQRTLMGATELRAAAASHAESVVAAGARIAVASGSAAAAFAWAELGRAAVLRYRPASSPHDPELAQALASLRWAVADSDSADGMAPDRATARRIARREAEVLAVTRRLRGDGAAARPVSALDVQRRLDGSVFVQYLAVDERILAVTVAASGRPALVDVAPADRVAEALSATTFDVRRRLTGFSGTRDAQRRDDGLRRLDELLIEPLRPSLGDRDLVVCPSAALTGVPWTLLPSLRGRTARVAPSATVWCRAVDAGPSGVGRVLAVAGPGLEAGRDEVTDIVSIHRGAHALVNGTATVDRVLAETATADTLHVAAHGHLRADNPLFSSLELADGPLTGYHLEALERVPRTIVLSACSSGAGRATTAEETLGLAWILMGLGATTVIAPLLDVPDTTTRPIMVDLHRRIVSGDAAADALTAVRHERAGDESELVAGSFVSFGA